MKTRLFTAGLSAIVLLAGATGLRAQNSTPQYDAFLGLKLIGQNYRDTSDRERAIQASFSTSTYDVNHDGKLDAKEFAAWEKRVRPVLETNPKFMKKFDGNRDGVLSDAEWNTACDELFELKAAPAGSTK